jgi:hypothetical protein
MMKKLIIAATLLALTVSAQARRGGNTQLPLKNSMAGFASESIEESTRLFYRLSPALKDQVIGAQVELVSGTDSNVQIELTDGTVANFNCIRFDDWSNGGTVLKKEVVCRK